MQQQGSDAAASQQLEAATVNLPPEETTANISQLIELDLLADKDKKKNEEDSEEEVGKKQNKCTCFFLVHSLNKKKE